MQLPQSATAFVEFMTNVWQSEITAVPDGALITGSPLYHDYHNARHTARLCGAVKRYGAGRGSNAYHYDMPDGSRVGIGSDGGSTWVVKKHHTTL